MAERDSDDSWRSITWGAAREKADAVSQALLDRGLGPDRPVMSLGRNTIDLALLKLGAMPVGIPIAPIYGWFTKGFDTADLKDAKAQLDELS